MESELLVKLVINITAILTLGAVAFKVVSEYFKDKKSTHIEDIESLVDSKIESRISGIEQKIESYRIEFNRNMIEIFKVFK